MISIYLGELKVLHLLAIWGKIWQLWKLLLRSWRWQTTLESEMMSSPDALCTLLIRFASMAWTTASESSFRPTWLCLIITILATQPKFLEPCGYCTVINYTFSFHVTNLAQLAGAIKYTNYNSAERWDSPNKCPGYDTKQSDCEAPVMLELWGM